MTRTVDLTNPSFYQGLLSEPCLDINADGALPVRFPLANANLAHPELMEQLMQPSGVSLSFNTDARVCRLRYRWATEGLACCSKRDFPPAGAVMPPATKPLWDVASFDLLVDGVLFDRQTNDPPIKGQSGDDMFMPTMQKPIKDFSYMLNNYGALHEKVNAIPQEKWGHYAAGEIVFKQLPAGYKRLDLYLPEKSSLRLCSLNLEGAAGINAINDSRPLLVTYGSSITQGMPFANGPSSVWPVVAARAADVRVVNLGVGGQCHFDQVMARLISKAPAACFAFELGINVHNMCSMNMRTFAEAAMGFILTVRDGHPKTPICVISPIWGGFREEQGWDTDIGFGAFKAKCPSLTEMRDLLKKMVELLRSRGDENLHLVDGLNLADEDVRMSMPDDLHPNGNGYEKIGIRFAELAFGPKGLLIPGRFQSQVGKNGNSRNRNEQQEHEVAMPAVGVPCFCTLQ